MQLGALLARLLATGCFSGKDHDHLQSAFHMTPGYEMDAAGFLGDQLHTTFRLMLLNSRSLVCLLPHC